jgi:regulator of replication initiation timing
MTRDEVVDKIGMIDKDLERLRKDVGNERQLSALVEYREYLQYELDQLEDENGS